jgi:hypothetical protein
MLDATCLQALYSETWSVHGSLQAPYLFVSNVSSILQLLPSLATAHTCLLWACWHRLMHAYAREEKCFMCKCALTMKMRVLRWNIKIHTSWSSPQVLLYFERVLVHKSVWFPSFQCERMYVRTYVQPVLEVGPCLTDTYISFVFFLPPWSCSNLCVCARGYSEEKHFTDDGSNLRWQ